MSGSNQIWKGDHFKRFAAPISPSDPEVSSHTDMTDEHLIDICFYTKFKKRPKTKQRSFYHVEPHWMIEATFCF